VPVALIALDFDPILRLGDVTIRWQTVALTGIVLAAILLAGLAARRAGLRPDDLLFIVVGITPGAVVGGRLGYVLAHADYYAANPAAIVDPGHGSASLALAVLGGLASGAVVARLLGTPVTPWLRVAAVPVLLAIGLGKLAMVLTGSGQGAPTDLEWATTFVGPGPWGSLAPDIPSHPSQVYEGVATLVVAALVGVGMAFGAFRRSGRRVFLLALGLWAVARFIVGTTWRDAEVLGPLNAEQLVTLAVVLVCGVLAGMTSRSRRRDAGVHNVDETAGPAWPEASSRPRF
jgi:phosphatidylglycerol:prolipoprotein diacylglycerol transferase